MRYDENDYHVEHDEYGGEEEPYYDEYDEETALREAKK